MKPVLSFPPELLLRAQPVKVVFFDVDGVLTDGGLYFTEQGETTKRFHTLDGHGIKLLQRAGITPAVVTGRDSPALRLRLQALGVTHARYGTEDKRPAAEAILAELGLDWAQAAAMGLLIAGRDSLDDRTASLVGQALAKANVSSWEHGLIRQGESQSAKLKARARYLVARGEADAPDIDGRVYIRGQLPVGRFAKVKVIGHTDYDLIAEPV